MNSVRIGLTFYYYVIFILLFDLSEKGYYTNIIKLSKHHEEPTANVKSYTLNSYFFSVIWYT